MNHEKTIDRNIEIIEECVKLLRHHRNKVFIDKKKNSIVESRRLLMDIIHTAKQLRIDFNEYHKSLPMVPRNVSKETIEKAQKKRKATMEKNKKKGKSNAKK